MCSSDLAYTRVVREDEKQPGLLFAGTETGLYISGDGGQSWHSFQLNLPVTPILDLVIRHDDLIVATSGRSFWILDDLGLVRQFPSREKEFFLFQPESAHLSNHGSPLNSNDSGFTGQSALRGVNPANGIVIYYNLPKLEKEQQIELEIFDQAGKRVNRFSSKKDEQFQRYAGGPSPAPVLSRDKGMNRFVWNMRYAGMPGIPTAYIEGSYRGHKAAPGKYRVRLTLGKKQLDADFEIRANPLYKVSSQDYLEFHQVMSEMEANLATMHRKTNRLFKYQGQLNRLLKMLPKTEKLKAVRLQGEELAKKLKTWDEEMVQRKSKA